MSGELIPIVMFIMIALILLAFFYFRFRANREIQATVRQAIDKGHELTPELMSRLGQPQNPKRADLRRGIVAIALGLAFATFAFILGEEDAMRPLMAIGTFPILIGIAYLGLWRFANDPD